MARTTFDRGGSFLNTIWRPPGSAAAQQNRQRAVVVDVAVADSAAVEEHRMVEQRPVAVLRVVKFAQKISDLLHVIRVDFRNFG